MVGGPLSERDRVRRAYDLRERLALGERYAPGNAANAFIVEERDRVLHEALGAAGLGDLAGRDVLDVGCGSGQELEKLVGSGAERARLHGLDLLEHRIGEGRRRAPDLDLRVGDATALPWPDASFDLELCFTLFTSVLDDGVRARIAREMRRVLRPGGAILWYDFRFDNPFNSDVRKVTRGDLERLFPGARLEVRPVTLAPPLARILVPLSARAAGVLAATRLLSTHLAGTIRIGGGA
jgi:SAM-dependent methyltransferase